MDLRLLDYFLRVAEFGSINRAAADLHISQPSLSRKIAELEHDIGAPLFSRDTTGTRLTEAGLHLASRARPLLREASLIREEIGHKSSAMVSFAMPSSLNRLVTVPAIEAIHRKHPTFSLHVYEGVSSALDVWLQRHMLDVAITALQSNTQHFKLTPLIYEPLLLVGPSDSNLSINENVTAEFAVRQKLILPESANPSRRYIEQQISKKQLQIRTLVQVESVVLCYDLARVGLGFTILPFSSIYEHFRNEHVAMAVITGLGVTWALAVNQDRAHSTAVMQVAEELRYFACSRVADPVWQLSSLV